VAGGAHPAHTHVPYVGATSMAVTRIVQIGLAKVFTSEAWIQSSPDAM
jgi:hypothetical protein